MTRSLIAAVSVLSSALPAAAQPASSTLVLVVRDARGPVAGAEVSLRDTTLRTDAAGRIATTLGTWEDVTIRAPDHATTRIRFEPAPGSRVERTVTLQPGARLEGIALDAGGNPLVDQSLSLRVSGDMPRVDTDAQGRWSFDAIGAGRHVIAFWADGCERFEQVIETDGVNARSIVLRCSRGAEIEGRVRTATGAAVPHARIEYDSNVVHADASGRYRVIGLAATDHVIWASAGSRASPVRTLILRSGEQVHVDFVIVESTISGTVSTGKAFVTARGASALVVAETDASGKYTVVVPPGTYTVSASADGKVSPPRTARSGERHADLAVSRGALVTGRAVAGGKPIAYFGVGLVRYIPTTFQAADGRFELEMLAVGTRNFVVVAPGYVPRVLPVTIAQLGTTIALGDVELVRGRTVRGRVVDERGRSVANATIDLAVDRNFGAGAPLDDLRRGRVVARTDAAGNFTITGIDPKSLVQLQAASGDQRSTRRELPAAAATVTLALRATGSLGGALAGPHSYVTRRITVRFLDDPDVHYDSTLAVGGDFAFDQLPAGDYEVTTPGSPPRRITIVAGRHTDLRLGSAPER